MEAEDLVGKVTVWCLLASTTKGKRGKDGLTGPSGEKGGSKHEVIFSEEEVQSVDRTLHLFQTSWKTRMLDIEDKKTAWLSMSSMLTFGVFP